MTQTQHKKRSFKKGCFGCLSIFVVLSAVFSLIALSAVWPAIFTPILVVIVIVGLVLLLMKQRKILLVISGIVLAGFFVTILLAIILKVINDDDFFKSQKGEYEFNDPNTNTTEYKEDVWVYTTVEGHVLDSQMVRNDPIVNHHRTWRDTQGKKYSGHFKVAKSAYGKAKDYRDNLFGEYFTWGDVYLYMILNDYKYFDKILHTYDSIGRARNLNNDEFAKMVVSSVQSIPYCFIAPASCDHPDVAQMIKDMQCPCLGHIRHYGVQSPIEFMYNQMGDCDTRAVYLYLILTHFNYDVAVLVSEYYQHAVLGINMPASGVALKHQGKKYYLWETTAEGYEPGQMPPDMKNTNFWFVALYN
jgi:hypothetical protein